MLTLIGKEGAGKTLPFEFLAEFIFGKEYAIQLGNIDNVLSKFNSPLDMKILIYIADLDGTSTNDNTLRKKMNQFKPFITDATYNIENKGLNVITRTNNLHFAGSSNEKGCLSITDDNRRHQAFCVSDKYVGNREYFQQLTSSLNQEVGDQFYTFFLTQDLSKLPDPNILIKTEIMEHLIELSLSHQKSFINALVKRDHKIPIPNNDNYIVKDILHQYSRERLLFDSNKQEIKIPKGHNAYIIESKVTFVTFSDPKPQLISKQLYDNGNEINILTECPRAAHQIGILKNALYDFYVAWCKHSCINRPGTPTWFFSEMKEILEDTKLNNETSMRYVISSDWILRVDESLLSICNEKSKMSYEQKVKDYMSGRPGYNAFDDLIQKHNKASSDSSDPTTLIF